ncbi:hypothetical protein C5167_000833 [Papaver somniferum]|uniref:Uncharacterized protein n=1 Tax=Papaver somniferum TaxID=3469 RepID=A0A4Y7KWY3_PAPSO|nr:hypothetical protein C5167_000833 [Papaver somniferum]
MATLSRMTKKAASSVIPLANRNCTSAIFSTPLKTSSTTIRSISTSNITNLSRQVSRATTIPTHHHISAPPNKGSNSEDTLLSMIESEINCSEDKFHEFVEAPTEFPFKIVDNVSKESIILTREFQGEEIKVTVYGPYHYQEEDSEDDQYEEKQEKSDPSQYVRLNVSISKKSGLTLELSVTADAADGIVRLLVKNPNAPHDYLAYKEPDILDLDEKLQKAFHTYLEVRGFEPSIGKFLCEYMTKKKHMECTTNTKWLKSLKNFISFTLKEFPFKIVEEDAGKRTITLTREYQGDEEIKVTASHEFGQCLLLKGIFSNKSGLTLEFYGSVRAADHGIRIKSVQKVQNAFHIYLEDRGIEPSITKVLYDCMVEAPRDFPFMIEDNPWNDRTITLTREYQGDEIKVIVHCHKDSGNYIELDVSVSNKSGFTLKCSVVDDYSTEGYTIRYLAVENPNASDDYIACGNDDFSHLDENLQKALRTYLEVRGIEFGIYNFLYEYMSNRKYKKYTAWLKKLKNFIAS